MDNRQSYEPCKLIKFSFGDFFQAKKMEIESEFQQFLTQPGGEQA